MEEINRDNMDGVEDGMEKQMLIGLEKEEKEVMAKDIGPTSLEVEMEKEKGKTEEVKDTSLECPTGAKEEKGKGKPVEEKVCYQCGEKGHIAYLCTKGKGKGNFMDGYSGGKGGGKTETSNCFKCCKVGHLSHQC